VLSTPQAGQGIPGGVDPHPDGNRILREAVPHQRLGYDNERQTIIPEF
jgi:hypothetical protein